MDYQLSCNSLYEDEKYYWFSEWQWNGFYRVEKTTLQGECLFHFPEEPLDKEELHQQMVKVGDWLVFCPLSGKEITAYHLVTRELKRFPLKEMSEAKNLHYARIDKFFFQCAYGNEVFFFPGSYPAIVVLHLETMDLTYYENEVTEIGALSPNPSSKLFNRYFGTGSQKGHKVYLPVACAKFLGVFDLEKKQLERIPAKGKAESFFSAEVVGDLCYLVDRDRKGVSCYNETTQEWKWIPFYGDVGISVEKLNNGGTFIHGSYLYAYPWSGKDFHKINLETGEVTPATLLLERLDSQHQYPYSFYMGMLCVRVEGDTVSFFCGKTCDWYEVHMVTEQWSKKCILANEDGQKMLSEKVWLGNESFSTDLKSYCTFVKERKPFKASEEKTQTIGQAILEATT